MCGIAGIIGNIENREQLMVQMLTTQQHRGPDARDNWKEDQVIFGHNRLSIIDLNQSANQPMHSSCGRYVIVFNGEIYNYKELKIQLLHEYDFKTQSDTEVIIAAYKKWGKNFLQRLNGMFSFAIWDKEDKKIFAARDRFGVKPFYYTTQQQCFFFSSEIKTLWAAGIPKQRNDFVWAKYLTYGSYGMPGETFWKDIYQLPGGHYLELEVHEENAFNISSLQPILWYDFVDNIQKTPLQDLGDLEENYLTLLKESIRFRFRADVPIGFNLSGGLDSSALLALVNQAFPSNNSIEAFTFYTGHQAYDELPWVEKMTEKTGNPLNKVLLKSDEVPSLIKEISYYQDEPFGGFPSLAYSLIFKEARKKGIKVLLDGQGMDEAWAGYDYYQTNTGYTVQGTTSSPVRPEVLNTDFLSLAEKESFNRPFESDLKNLQYRDLFYTKIPRALRFNDRVSMMHSTELREPFLDYRLVELAFAQNDDVKIKNTQSKWLLREIVKDLLGSHIALAPKRPLQTPQREWITGVLKDFVSDQITKFKKLDFVDGKKMDSIWTSYLAGNNDNSFYIWQWINLNQLSGN